MLKKLFAPIVLVLLVAACNPPTPSPALDISSRAPAAGATAVALDANVSATFSQAVDPATLTADSFTLTTGSGDAMVEVAGAVGYDADTRTATFDPTADLAPATAYTATLTTDVTSAAGRALSRDSSWSFTTADPVPGVTIAEGDQVLSVDDEPVQLTAVVFPADDTVTWASGDDAVATVSAEGLLTPVAPGTTTVTATSDTDATLFDEISVTVAEPLTTVLGADSLEAVAHIEQAVVVPAPTLSSNGEGELTWSITAGELPPSFSVAQSVTGYVYEDSYGFSLDTATGEVSGTTAYPGVYTWTLTVTDEAGQSASVDYSLTLDVSLEYVRPGDGTEVTTVEFSTLDVDTVVVEGDRVRLSGVHDTRDLDPAFLDDFFFEMNHDSDFEINAGDGTITYTSGVAGVFDVIVTVTYNGDPELLDNTGTHAMTLTAQEPSP